jgi:hypothetical protein
LSLLIVGEVGGKRLGLYAGVGAGSGVGAYLLAMVARGILSDRMSLRRQRASERERLLGWLPEGGLLFEGVVEWRESLEREGGADRGGGTTATLTALAVDRPRGRIAVARGHLPGVPIEEVARGAVRGWRTARVDGRSRRSAGRVVEIELVHERVPEDYFPPGFGSPGMCRWRRYELRARSDREAEALRAALETALGAERVPADGGQEVGRSENG